MILLEINTADVAVVEFERDAPRSVYVNRIPNWLKASQRMEIKAWNVHFLRPRDNVQAVQAPQDAYMHLRIYLSGPPMLPKLG
jgi:hypothetical protein